MGTLASCVICGTRLRGKQTRFCTRACKNADTNHRHQSYLAQQARGRARKLLLLRERGGRCEICGYRANHAALAFHHVDPTTKSFELDLRAFSNRSAEERRTEAAKCMLVCANCHAELHHPQCAMPIDDPP